MPSNAVHTEAELPSIRLLQFPTTLRIIVFIYAPPGDCPLLSVTLLEVVPDCDNNQFSVRFRMAALQAAEWAIPNVSYVQNGGTPQAMSSTLDAIETIGPFDSGDIVQIFATNVDLPECVYISALQSHTCAPPCPTEFPLGSSELAWNTDTATWNLTFAFAVGAQFIFYAAYYEVNGDNPQSIEVTSVPVVLGPFNVDDEIIIYVAPIQAGCDILTFAIVAPEVPNFEMFNGNSIVPDCDNNQFSQVWELYAVDPGNPLGQQPGDFSYRIDNGPWIIYGPVTWGDTVTIGPFPSGSSVEIDVRVENATLPWNPHLVNDLIIAYTCPDACSSYPDEPTKIDVDFETTSDSQAFLEGVGLPIGTSFLILDHPDGTPIGSPTLFTDNTGNKVEVVAPGTGTGGSDWLVTPLASGTVVNILANAASEDYLKWYVVRSSGSGTSVYASGKFCLNWLYQPHTAIDPLSDGRLFTRSFYTSDRADDTEGEICRKWQYETGSTFGGTYTPVAPKYTEVQGFDDSIAPGSFAGLFVRIRYFGGPAGTFSQGVSYARLF